MPDALKDFNVNIGTLLTIAAGIVAVSATSFAVLTGLDARIDDRMDGRVKPIERRLAEMQETIKENEGRRNAQYGNIIQKLDEMQTRAHSSPSPAARR